MRFVVFAGMDSRFRGNDRTIRAAIMKRLDEEWIPAFAGMAGVRGNGRGAREWQGCGLVCSWELIPAFAGMTGVRGNGRGARE